MIRAIVGIVVMLVVGVPILMLNLSALGMQDQVEEVMGGPRSVPSGVASAGRTINDWVDDAREGRLAEALFDPVMITDHRSVAWERTRVTAADVLAPGEAAPTSREEEELWITARGLALAQADGCPAILDTIATRCSAGRLDVARNDDGTFRVQARLGFAPADDPGPVPARGRGVDLQDVTLRIPEQRGLRVPVAGIPDAQRQLLLAAQEACRTLRAEQGTCVIRSVRFVQIGTGDTRDITASVTLTTLVAQGDGRQAALDVPGSVQQAAVIPGTEAPAAAASGGMFGMLKGLMGGEGDGASAGAASGGTPRVLQGGGARSADNTLSVNR